MGNSCKKPKVEAPTVPDLDAPDVSVIDVDVDAVDVDIKRPKLGSIDGSLPSLSRSNGSDDGSEGDNRNRRRRKRRSNKNGSGSGSGGGSGSGEKGSDGEDKPRRRRRRKSRKGGDGDKDGEDGSYTYETEDPGFFGWLSGDEGARRRVRRSAATADQLSESSSWGIDNAFDKTARGFMGFLGFEEDPDEKAQRRQARKKGGDESGKEDSGSGGEGDKEGDEGKSGRRRRRRRPRPDANGDAGSDKGSDKGKGSGSDAGSHDKGGDEGKKDELDSSINKAKADKKPLSAHEREVVDKMTALLHERFHDDEGEAFRAFDKDGDGEIDPDEMFTMLADAGIGNMLTRSRWAKGIMDKFDTDHNGKISLEEFMSQYEKRKKKREAEAMGK